MIKELKLNFFKMSLEGLLEAAKIVEQRENNGKETETLFCEDNDWQILS